MRRLVLTSLALIALAGAALAQPSLTPRPVVPLETPVSQTTTPRHGPTPLDPADLDPFLAGVVQTQLHRDDIAGAVVVIVKDGRLLFARGYGYADVAKKTPVDPATTGFRIASISKTFTGTSVMQLVQAGKLDLDRDVSAYLDFPLKRRFPQPITLRRLLTHTAGFEERGKNFLIGPNAPLPSLRDYLVRNQPGQVNAPGTRIAYSNYGVSLAGYIAQRVGGQPWEDEVATGIFRPLGMTRTTAAQPLPPELAASLSKEYNRASSGPVPFQSIPDRPAGAITTTGEDMARYMLAHLATGDTPILNAATLAEMHRQQWTAKPGVDGIAINFYEVDGHGHRVLSHAGDLSRFHSELWLMPDQKLGVFIAYNSTGLGAIRPREEFWNAFLDRYYPVTGAMPPAASTAKADAPAVAGAYLATRRAETSVLAPFYLIGQAQVSASPDGTITLPGLMTEPSGVAIRWREIGPLLYQAVGGTRRIGFVRDASGRVALFAGGATLEAERPNVWQTLPMLELLYGGALLVLLISAAQWPLGAWARRRYRRPLSEMLDESARRERLLIRLSGLLALVFMLGWCGFFLEGASNLSLLSVSSDPYLRVFQVIAILELLATIVSLWAAWRVWRRRSGGWGYRIGLTFLVLALISVASFILRFHVLSPSLNY